MLDVYPLSLWLYQSFISRGETWHTLSPCVKLDIFVKIFAVSLLHTAPAPSLILLVEKLTFKKITNFQGIIECAPLLNKILALEEYCARAHRKGLPLPPLIEKAIF